VPEILRVYYEPRFHLCFSRPEIYALLAVASAHEDALCRSTAEEGGFLYELRSMLEGPQDLPKHVEPVGERYEERVFSLEEVQLLGKILEPLGHASAEVQANLLEVPPIISECLLRKPLEEVV
jgi:hypothetical protein